ncbi:MAG TPA: hypothetical protein VHO46_04740 [Bacteroidales bacterium]|nr:hypothetical protein [Bacteroidales bacterium]
MKKLIRLTIFLSLPFAVYSCNKIESLPAEPYIEYRSFEIFDTVDILGNSNKGGRLKFYFEDGDGDVGLDPSTGEESDSNNLIITPFRKINGSMVQVLRDTVNPDPFFISSFRIPYMEKLGQNKILKGIIEVTFKYSFFSVYDTIKYDFYITDRAFNRSNTVSTNEIIVGENNVY